MSRTITGNDGGEACGVWAQGSGMLPEARMSIYEIHWGLHLNFVPLYRTLNTKFSSSVQKHPRKTFSDFTWLHPPCLQSEHQVQGGLLHKFNMVMTLKGGGAKIRYGFLSMCRCNQFHAVWHSSSALGLHEVKEKGWAPTICCSKPWFAWCNQSGERQLKRRAGAEMARFMTTE